MQGLCRCPALGSAGTAAPWQSCRAQGPVPQSGEQGQLSMHTHSGKCQVTLVNPNCYSDKASTKPGLLAHTGFYTVQPPIIVREYKLHSVICLGSKNETFIPKSPLKKAITHVLLNFRGSCFCVFSSYRLDKRLKNSVLKTDSSKLSYSCSCRMKMSSCMVLQGNQNIYHPV